MTMVHVRPICITAEFGRSGDLTQDRDVSSAVDSRPPAGRKIDSWLWEIVCFLYCGQPKPRTLLRGLKLQVIAICCAYSLALWRELVDEELYNLNTNSVFWFPAFDSLHLIPCRLIMVTDMVILSQVHFRGEERRLFLCIELVTNSFLGQIIFLPCSSYF